MKIFLSSTFKDLATERAAVCEALTRMSAQYSAMEYFGSFSDEPLAKCLAKVRSSDVVVLLLGSKYGFVPDGHDKSMTELEYREAIESKIPVLAYLKSMPPHRLEDEIAVFRDIVSKAHGRSEFTSPDDLAWQVVSDLAREFLIPMGENAAEVAQNVFFGDILMGSLSTRHSAREYSGFRDA